MAASCGTLESSSLGTAPGLSTTSSLPSWGPLLGVSLIGFEGVSEAIDDVVSPSVGSKLVSEANVDVTSDVVIDIGSEDTNIISKDVSGVSKVAVDMASGISDDIVSNAVVGAAFEVVSDIVPKVTAGVLSDASFDTVFDVVSEMIVDVVSTVNVISISKVADEISEVTTDTMSETIVVVVSGAIDA